MLSAAFWGDCLFGPHTPIAARFQAEMEPWASEAALPATERQWYPLLWDGAAQFYPWRMLAARTLRRGELAVWNPHQFCGYPFVANGQSALFYPPNWLLALVDVRWGMGLLVALHYVLAAGLTWAFCRRIGLAHVAGAFAGVAFAWGGFMVGWTELPTLHNVATWVPGALLGVALIFDRSRWGVPVLAVSLAMSVLAGHFQIAAYVWLAALVYVLARSLWAAVRRLPLPAGRLAAGFALALLLASAQLLPTLEMAANSSRARAGSTEQMLEFHLARVLQPQELPALLLPNLYGNPAHGDYVLARYGLPYAEHCGFVGITTVVLMLAGLALGRRRHRMFFALVALGALNVAMGSFLARWLFVGVPGLGQAGGFTRILSVYTFAMAVGGGIGLDALRRRLWHGGGERGGRGVLASVVGALALVLLLAELVPWAHEYLPRTRREHVYAMTPTAHRLQQGDGRVLAVTPRGNWGMARTPEALLPPNAATVYGYDSVSGYDSLFPESYRTFVSRAEGGQPSPPVNGNMLLPEDGDDPLYAAAGLSVVATMPGGRVGRGVDVRAVDGLPRAFVAPDGPAWERALAASMRGQRDGGDALRAVEAAGWRREGVGTIVALPSAIRGSEPWLVVSETFYPGWNAYVHGAQRKVRSIADTFCGVELHADDDEVRLVFEPVSLQVGIFAALVGAGGLAGVFAAGRAGRDRRD